MVGSRRGFLAKVLRWRARAPQAKQYGLQDRLQTRPPPTTADYTPLLADYNDADRSRQKAGGRDTTRHFIFHRLFAYPPISVGIISRHHTRQV